MIASRAWIKTIAVACQLKPSMLGFRLTSFLALLVILSACSESELILDGKRVSVIPNIANTVSDPAAFAEGAGLTDAIVNLNAEHPGLNAGHTGGNVHFDLPFVKLWRSFIGGKGNNLTDLAQPVISDGKVFAVAPNGIVTAFDMKNGDIIWQANIEDFSDDPLPGIAGGLAIGGNVLFAHAGGQNIAALSVKDGSTIWSTALRLPVRGGPTVISDKAIVITNLDGNVFVYRQSDGLPLWERAGLPVSTVVYGAPSPAVSGDQIVVAGNGGDISLLDTNSGQIIWSDSLATVNLRTPLQSLGDIRAHPVHDGGLVFVVSQAGQIAAFNSRTGLLVWDQPIGGIEMPWLAGKTLFLLTIDGRLYALRRSDGVVRWVVDLPGALPEGSIAAFDIPRYVGPFVVNGEVMVISKSGTLFAFDADSGVGDKKFQVGNDVVTAPQLGGGIMFVLSKNGDLVAFQ
ncbi:PQQ-binding-like beta-propeller repeat protein [Candidatus Puniceispirillum sp.]|nr:PQQ-binding-like beta-propeller repeat protein [Candidatus Puniceispirillum sp.]